MVKAARFVVLVLGTLGCSACVTAQPSQCPSAAPRPQPQASVAPDSAAALLRSVREDEDAEPLTKLHVVINDQREAARMQAHCGSTACPALVSTFNQHFKLWLTSARGQWLVISVVDGKTSLPAKYQADYLPEPLAQIGARTDAQPSGRLDRTLGDGTHVVVLYGKDEEGVLAQIDKVTFDKP
jgi:hypothetical protein